MSYQLRRLEEALGLPLFERGNGRLRPNPAGRRLFGCCRDMGRDWTRVRDALREPAPDHAPPLRIAAVSGYGRYVLLPLFRDGPLADLPIRMRFPTADDVAREVEDGACDLGFVHVLPARSRLDCRPVGTEEIVLAAPAHSPAPALDLAALRRMRFVTYDESDYVFATWFTQVLGASPGQLDVAAHFEELEEVLDWVAAGRGLSIVPADCLARYPRRGEVAAVRKPGSPCRNTVYARLPPAGGVHPAVERTLAVVRAASAAARP
ncbi:LysR family transcriptional regulator [Fulvimonas soli]|uniref:DNA-binding transcriptional LysR family regulator n=1 Tax=Fulvimonas soli TaxID=155197 RepID=A0A316IHW2_9GAMM|nr:LysR family transcriptional regulator [Fulvimonas soli]PWK92749.1 DNA-binding transcriptional LysR family regulator [Fulvimonas soli]TNY28028.1 hypothetical protein BV497_00015 [Fulvimonas soli]